MVKKIKFNEEVSKITFAQGMEKWYKHCRANNYAEKTIIYYEKFALFPEYIPPSSPK